ncbi:MAG: hypothetical protein ACTH30_05390 [Leucobacter sp.]
MAIPTTTFALPAPAPTTKFKDLGKELLDFGNAIDALLRGFDMNGTDPAYLLSRVVALETWRTSATAKITALEQASAERGWTKRNATAVTLNATNYLLIASAFGTPTGKNGMTYDAGNGFVIPKTGRYRVHLSFMAQVSPNTSTILGAISTRVNPAYQDLRAMQTAGVVQSLCAVSLEEELDLVQGDVVRPYGLCSAGTAALNTVIGSFSVRRAD